MKLLVLAVLFSLFSSMNVFANCEAKRNDCSAYRCLDNEFKCGNSGYFINFGERYCNQFLQHRSRYSDKAKVWLREVAYCLQEKATDLPKNLTCGEVKENSISDHVECYTDTGFCALPIGDKLRLYTELTGTVTKLFSLKFFGAIFQIHGNCVF